MTGMPAINTMYNALLKRDTSFEGIFYVAVKTTGIFCRPSCPARKPDIKNVEFFPSVKEALFAGYKPCKRCSPLKPLGNTPGWLDKLLKEVAENTDCRWKDYDLRIRDFDPNRVRRWFKKNYGITFHSYLRYLRLGKALGNIKYGESITQTAFDFGFESLSGFRDAVKKITGIPAGKNREKSIVFLNRILTPLGPMIAGANEDGICLLEFMDRRMLETQIKILTKKINCNFVPGTNHHIEKLNEELKEYFDGKIKRFSIPVIMYGTDFQKKVWQKLLEIPYGKTISYETLANKIYNPNAKRAVAKANGDNRISILIPCHRVIGKDGTLTGYGGGLWRKKHLLDLEKRNNGILE